MIGLLARLQRTVFIDRMRRSAPPASPPRWASGWRRAKRSCCSPRARTGDGTRILPLRSSLLGAAHEALGPREDGDVTVYPLRSPIPASNGMAGGATNARCSPGMATPNSRRHLKTLMNMGAIDVELAWGAPISMGKKTSRKRRRGMPRSRSAGRGRRP